MPSFTYLKRRLGREFSSKCNVVLCAEHPWVWVSLEERESSLGVSLPVIFKANVCLFVSYLSMKQILTLDF